MPTANDLGRDFEENVGNALQRIKEEFPTRILVSKNPRILLHNKEVVIPDFEIAIDFPHIYSKYLIEYQSRKKSSKSILHKIQHIRARSGKYKFIFVYNRFLSPEINRALIEEGVLVFAYEDFIVFTQRIRTVLNATPPPINTGEYGGGGWDGGVEEEE